MLFFFLMNGCLYTGENVTLRATLSGEVRCLQDETIDDCLIESGEVTVFARIAESGEILDGEPGAGSVVLTIEAPELEEIVVFFWAEDARGYRVEPTPAGAWDFALLGGQERAVLEDAIYSEEDDGEISLFVRYTQ